MVKCLFQLLFPLVPALAYAQSPYPCPSAPTRITSPLSCTAGVDGTFIDSNSWGTNGYVITTPGTYCLNFSPPSTNHGGITINANNVVLKGQNRQFYGDVTLADRQNVTIQNITTFGQLRITTTHLPSLTANIVVRDSVFDLSGATNKGDGAMSVDAGSNISILNSTFKCDCSQLDPTYDASSSTCVAADATSRLNQVGDEDKISPFIFDGNIVESNCLKTTRFIGAKHYVALLPGDIDWATPIVEHTIRNNFIHSTRNKVGDEVTAFTWRRAKASPTKRNIFANNSIISDGNANALYLRDDVDNVDFTGNCFDTKNPSRLAMFYATVMFSSGNNSASVSDPSGLTFTGNRFFANDTPAFNEAGLEENPVSDNNRNIFRNNYFASRGGSAITIGGQVGALYDHNTFYSDADESVAVNFDIDRNASPSPIIRTTEFSNNIIACSKHIQDGSLMRSECLKPPGAANYTGTNNIFYNYFAPVKVQSDSSGPIPFASWQSQGEDQSSVERDPLFLNRSGFDLRTSTAPPSCHIGNGYAGAFSCDPDSLSPAAPANLVVGP
jgi:hypothetical protein